MKNYLYQLLNSALQQLQNDRAVTLDNSIIQIQHSRDKQHGDFSTNIALLLAKPLQEKPREVAQLIVERIPKNNKIEKVEIAGAGFINFFLNPLSHYEVIGRILKEGKNYGRSNLGNNLSVQVEFVSANPTGPLHVGHGRGAAYGATLANVLEATGFKVQREYYVNDAGRQMDILATSVWLRYLELCGETFVFPSNGYRGDYIKAISQAIYQQEEKIFRHPAAEVFAQLPEDYNLAQQSGDKEAHIDALVSKAKSLLGSRYSVIFNAGLTAILADIRDDLAEFGVKYDSWFSEQSLLNTAAVNSVIQKLQTKNYLYKQEGALWFKSTDFGDDKDRVVLRENGQPTYFATDIAYHLHKFERGFSRVINIWGSDHHGYVPRIKATLQALDIDPTQLTVQLVQFAVLYRGKEKIQMSTRSGSFVTLRELRQEVGNDAARFFYVMRKPDQHMDFDLELAKSESKDNPVYYIQYAHARVCSMLQKFKAMGHSETNDMAVLTQLTLDEELEILQQLAQYPDTLATAAQTLEPHIIAHYLRELAGRFHSYYNAYKILCDDEQLRQARIFLSQATRQVVANGLDLLGVSAPTSM